MAPWRRKIKALLKRRRQGEGEKPSEVSAGSPLAFFSAEEGGGSPADRLRALELKLARTEEYLTDILTYKAGEKALALSAGANPYQSREKLVAELVNKYKGYARAGNQLVQRIVDTRAAFAMASGLSVRPVDPESGRDELLFIRRLIRLNQLDGQFGQQLAVEKELEGQVLLVLEFDPEADNVRLRFISWNDTHYEVRYSDESYARIEAVSYENQRGQTVHLPPERTVFIKFNARIHSREGVPTLSGLLPEAEDIDYALRDWRKINRFFASPTPYFRTRDIQEAKDLYQRLLAPGVNWKIGKVFAGPADFSLVGMNDAGYESIRQEIETKVKILAGGAGVPVQFLGFPEFMSNRATAENTMEPVALISISEQRSWRGGFAELFDKAVLLYNQAAHSNRPPSSPAGWNHASASSPPPRLNVSRISTSLSGRPEPSPWKLSSNSSPTWTLIKTRRPTTASPTALWKMKLDGGPNMPEKPRRRPPTRAGKRLVLLRCRIQETALAEVRDRMGKAGFAALCSRDPHPMFVELLTAHEGVSTGRLIAPGGKGRPTPKRWSRERIRELLRRLRRGTPVFDGHSTVPGPRRPVGEVVCAAEKFLDGAAAAAGVAYIHDPKTRDRIRRRELDTCSLEAEVECYRDPAATDDSWIVSAVRRVTGIALGNSARQKPGFPAAALLAAVEEFSAENHDAPSGLPSAPPSPGQEKTPADLEQKIAELIRRSLEQEKKMEALAETISRFQNQEKQTRRADAETAPDRKGRIAAPPEKPAADGPFANPLIPRPRGW